MKRFAGLLPIAAVLLMVHVAPAANTFAASLRDKPDEWFATDEGKQTIANIISWQEPNGGWAKGYDGKRAYKEGDSYGEWHGATTIDNQTTYTELRVLARAYTQSHDPKILASFNRGVDFLLKAQYENGGWPQRFPLPDNYGRDITFNDDAMTGVMVLFFDMSQGAAPFQFVDGDLRKKVAAAFDRGLDCIIKSQVKVNGKPTAWAQQYDAKTLMPSKARAYELPSLTADESAGIVMMLMRIEKPSDEVKQAIDAAVAWFEASKVTGKRIEKPKNPASTRGFDVVLVDDPAAAPIWARFYDLDTGKPFVVGRDGVKHDSLAEIEIERRAGYAWYNPWGKKVLDAYPKWQARIGASAASAPATEKR